MANTERFHVEQVMRLHDLKGFPRTEQGIRELLRVLQQTAPSQTAARALMDLVIETCTFCPSPAELLTLSRSNYSGVQQQRRELCGQCFDGFEVGWFARDLTLNGRSRWRRLSEAEGRRRQLKGDPDVNTGAGPCPRCANVA